MASLRAVARKAVFAALLSSAAVASFIVTLRIMPAARPALTASSMRSMLDALEACGQQDAQKKSACLADATTISASISALKPQEYDFFRAANFNVYVMNQFIVLNRKTCGAGDITVDEFHYRAWPVSKADLPERSREHGFIGGVQSFSKSGFRAGPACLMVLKLPFAGLEQLEIGQYDRVARKWEWRVHEKI